MKIKKYTRVTAFFLAVCTVLLMLPLSVRADEYWPDGVKTQSKSAIVMEVNTGTVLYEKKSHEKHYPASITKIMTVLLAIENCDMDEVVTFSADAVFKNEGDTSHIARNLGEKLTMEQVCMRLCWSLPMNVLMRLRSMWGRNWVVITGRLLT